jgi:hypothetical protein
MESEMTIEEAVLIKADIGRIWKLFTDLDSWKDWNSVLRSTGSAANRIAEGERLRYSLHHLDIPMEIELKVDEVIDRQRVVWSGTWSAISLHHEFLFRQATNGVLVMSRETFRGLPLLFGAIAFPESTVRDMTMGLLRDLKKAAEKSD